MRRHPYDKQPHTYAFAFFGAVGIIFLLILAAVFVPQGAPEAQAGERDVNTAIRQLNQSVQSLQTEVRNLKARVGVLEALPTAKRELAAKRAAERRRR